MNKGMGTIPNKPCTCEKSKPNRVKRLFLILFSDVLRFHVTLVYVSTQEWTVHAEALNQRQPLCHPVLSSVPITGLLTCPLRPCLSLFRNRVPGMFNPGSLSRPPRVPAWFLSFPRNLLGSQSCHHNF